MMDFITKLPKTIFQNDAIMVVADKLTKETHFIPVKTTHKETHIADIYMKEIARLHGILKSIVLREFRNLLLNFGKDFSRGFVQV